MRIHKVPAMLIAFLAMVTAGSACTNNFMTAVPETVLVGGATGRQGNAVVTELLKRGYQVRALTRNPDSDKAKQLAKPGVEIVQGDYGDPQSLLNAMDGVAKAFFYSGFSRNELEEGLNVLAAAQSAGVEHLIYSSGAAAEPGKGLPGAKMSIEEAIVDSGIDYTVLRPVAFFENLTGQQKRVAKAGVVDSRDPNRLLHFIGVSDIGFFVGEAVDNPADWRGVAMNIASETMTVAEYAATIERVMGQPVPYNQQPLEEYLAAMPKPLRALFRWYEEVGYEADVDQLRQRYPSLSTLEEYLRATGWENWQPPT